jgi:putative sterol carrier protein
MNGLQLERLVAVPTCVIGMEWAIEETLKYMSEREAFGRPISKFQVLRHRIAQMASEVESLKAFSYHCCRLYDDKVYDVKLCSMAKLLATELAEKVSTQCLQMFGGYGFMEEYPLARMYRDVRVGTIGGGSSEIMREIIAKIVIDDVGYQKANVDKHSTNGKTAAPPVNLFEAIQGKASQAAPLGSTLKFDFGGDVLYIDGTLHTNMVSTDDRVADCTIKVSKTDFQALMGGKLDPMSAVMSGKIQIDGDMSVAMKLQSLFG